ncbi:peptidoglycan bridge formation glycyltransferase FemA/FemB family protein [Rothia sp. AR01]|uniref:Peptidoglycan bridge formation glycyltransferase FemA/FemB family protein n=1 Tax=Rothia santali TaxID=2949643 RepID=A0A9X2KME5_9MICC|nr:peptidoglycan bridge formation glycyltransferase FemA/FemB family protein [Rothia santali]MCP3427106.1 peptidoglycan bridge formation glycyltransferase FemA/FemB family protein [Rothia santali]
MTEQRTRPRTVVGPQSVLQSAAWGDFQGRVDRPVRSLSGEGWRALVVEESTAVGTCWYLPYGPVAEGPEQLAAALRSLREAARAAGAGWLRVEPILDVVRGPAAAGTGEASRVLGRSRAVAAPRDIQPRRSRWIDVARSEEEILRDMTGTNRNLWRRHRDKDLSITASSDPGEVEVLIGLLEGSAQRNDFRAHDAGYLREAARTLLPRDAATVYVTRHRGEPVCAMMVYDSPSTRIFAHSAMKEGQRKLRPNQPMVVQAILDAAARGQEIADLFGIAPTDDPEHPWAGFSGFKRSFGGYDVNLTGTWDIPVTAWRYRLYVGLRRARRLQRAVRGGLGRLLAHP